MTELKGVIHDTETICVGICAQTLENHGYWYFLVVQWLRFHTPNAGGLGSISGQGIHMPQLRVCMAQLKIPHAAVKNIEDSACHN